jgi:hypothetical protein
MSGSVKSKPGGRFGCVDGMGPLLDTKSSSRPLLPNKPLLHHGWEALRQDRHPNCNVFSRDEFPASRRSAWLDLSGKHRTTERASGMRIVLSDFMSLDGVVQAPGGEGGRRPDLHLPAGRTFTRLARNDLVAPATMVMLWCRSPAVRGPRGITAKGGT